MITEIYHRIADLITRKESAKYFWKLYTKANNSTNLVIKYYYRYKFHKLNKENSSGIPITSKFENCPFFPHGLSGIFISNYASIGKNCVIFQQVTIGSNTLGDSKGKGAPMIGDNVYIGSGAKIIGNVRIGDNVRIGANCIVVKNIPNNCTVVLQSPRIIQHKNIKDNTFIGRKI